MATEDLKYTEKFSGTGYGVNGKEEHTLNVDLPQVDTGLQSKHYKIHLEGTFTWDLQEYAHSEKQAFETALNQLHQFMKDACCKLVVNVE